MDADIYLALVTIHGTIMVFFVLTAGLSGTFSNLLIPLQIGARDMASGFLNMISYWLFFLSSVIMIISLFVEAGPAAAGWTIYPPFKRIALSARRLWSRNDFVVSFNGYLYCFVIIRISKLHCNGTKFENKRNVNDTTSVNNMGVFHHRCYWSGFFSSIIICGLIINHGP